ncbi:threonylcarbamoyl-AMP synthase [Candidatus Peribacteria bacterium RIFCSPHIGHO2_02_FULL_49_16]|nr:MAG: threonylcarbamoyl-AMP synthase [Candidatus Peribacteria bacterium RIFCSPHIGHO2_01_FULL_49_38]OGJ60006.1 MAG: threonylcarbamoyl-AMP synthase [Candidatus Peribacteria bacterium RIFCSPHIGHO2_02_FULL_49_16]
MRILPPTTDGIAASSDVLEKGGVVIYPTETCYGLACDLSNPEAVVKLFTLKNRPTDQPVSALFSSLKEAKNYVEWSEKAEELAKKHLPGPLTLVLPMKEKAPHQLFPLPRTHDQLSPFPSLGIRLSSHPIAQKLAEAYGKPISTTSANISGHPPCYTPKEIQEYFADADASVVLLDGGKLPKNSPSTVISLVHGTMKHIRNKTSILSTCIALAANALILP